MIGKSIAHYKITEKLGEGGMGEVYRATDTKLKRPVALKILPENFAADPHRMGRFQREAEVLASLNHPNIAGIYGLETEGSVHAIAMELVEGETLAGRIRRGPISLEEVLQISLQIATALEAAHEKGVIHRDLKPANVILNPEGTVKVLDFGLAKAVDAKTDAELDLSQSPTLTMQATQAGIILGTAAYMSPEQAKGLAADRRADIWSFGVVLWEMLTAQQAFQAATLTETMAAVMLREPDFDSLPSTLPGRIRRLLERCLTKDVRQRLQSIGEARIAIEQTLAGNQIEAGSLTPAPVSKSSPWPWILLATIAIAGVVALGWLVLSPGTAPPQVASFELELTGQRLTLRRGGISGSYFAMSPDGRQVALLAAQGNGPVQIHLRAVDQFGFLPLPGTEGASFPTFSPDGEWIAFVSEGSLKKVRVSGGLPIEVAQQGGPSAWLKGTIVFQVDDDLYQLPEGGGSPTLLLEGNVAWVHAIPDTDRILVTTTVDNEFSIGTLTIQDPTISVVIENGSWPQYAGGYLVYAQRATQAGSERFTGGLLALPFDVETGSSTGAPIPILEGVDVGSGGAAHFLLSADGDLVYRPGVGDSAGILLLRMNPAGDHELLAEGKQHWRNLSLSADGMRLAYEVDGDIYIFDLNRRVQTRLTFGGTREGAPVFSRNSPEIAFSQGDSLWVQDPNPGAEARQLLEKPGTSLAARSWSPDGKFLVFDSGSLGEQDIWLCPLNEADGEPRPLAATPFAEWGGQVSPDGKWLAFTSVESGRPEVFVQSFPEPGSRIQVSVQGGINSKWSPDGRKIYFVSLQRIWAAEVDLDNGEIGLPSPVTEPFSSLRLSDSILDSRILDYVLAPDGSLLATTVDRRYAGPSDANVRLVLNFLQVIKQKVGAP